MCLAFRRRITYARVYIYIYDSAVHILRSRETPHRTGRIVIYVNIILCTVTAAFAYDLNDGVSAEFVSFARRR